MAKTHEGITDTTLCPRKVWSDKVGLEELLEQEGDAQPHADCLFIHWD